MSLPTWLSQGTEREGEAGYHRYIEKAKVGRTSPSCENIRAASFFFSNCHKNNGRMSPTPPALSALGHCTQSPVTFPFGPYVTYVQQEHARREVLHNDPVSGYRVFSMLLLCHPSGRVFREYSVADTDQLATQSTSYSQFNVHDWYILSIDYSMTRYKVFRYLVLAVLVGVAYVFLSQRPPGLGEGPLPADVHKTFKASNGDDRDHHNDGRLSSTLREDVAKHAVPKEVLDMMRMAKKKTDSNNTVSIGYPTPRHIAERKGEKQMTMYDMAMALPTARERREFIAELSHRRVCFHHIPKTGGTNFVFKDIFKVLFAWKEFENEDNQLHLGPLLGPDVRFDKMGHTDKPGCLDGAVISILRDPKERYLSAYRNSKAIGKACVLGSDKYAEECACCGVNFTDLLAIAFKRDAVPLTDFLKPDIIAENQMTQMLLGEEVVSYCRKHDTNEACRQMIRHRLMSNYLLIGFSEYYEDFIGQYIDLFALRDIPELMEDKEKKQFVWQNRTVVQVKPDDFQGLTKAFDDLNPEEAQHVLKYTDVDRVLYDEALSLFLHERNGTPAFKKRKKKMKDD